jgi:hypothetical protein
VRVSNPPPLLERFSGRVALPFSREALAIAARFWNNGALDDCGARALEVIRLADYCLSDALVAAACAQLAARIKNHPDPHRVALGVVRAELPRRAL